VGRRQKDGEEKQATKKVEAAGECRLRRYPQHLHFVAGLLSGKKNGFERTVLSGANPGRQAASSLRIMRKGKPCLISSR